MKTLLLSALLALSLSANAQILPAESTTHEINMRLDLFRQTHEAGVALIVLGSAALILSENLTDRKRDMRVVGWTLGAVGAGAILYSPTQLNRTHQFYLFRRKGGKTY